MGNAKKSEKARKDNHLQTTVIRCLLPIANYRFLIRQLLYFIKSQFEL